MLSAKHGGIVNRRILIECLGGLFLGLGAYGLIEHPDRRAYGLVCLALGVIWLVIGSRMRAKERPNA